MLRRIRPLSLLFLLAALSGCLGKPEPAPEAGFIPKGEVFYSREIPFNKSWWNPKTDFSQFKEIYIAPVNTEHLLKMSWWQEVERGASLQKDIPGLALYAQQTIRNAFIKDRGHRFRVVDYPHADTLVLSFALVEVVPTKTTLKYAGLLPPLMIPMRIAGLGSKSTAAFEAKMTAGPNGKIVAMFADREAEKLSIFTVKDYSWYGHAKGLIREWANQLVQVCHKERNQVIKDSSWFELKPW